MQLKKEEEQEKLRQRNWLRNKRCNLLNYRGRPKRPFQQLQRELQSKQNLLWIVVFRIFYEGEGGSVDSMSTYEANEDDWPQVSSSSLADASADLEAKYKAVMEAPEPKDPISNKIAQFYQDTLKIQKLQNAGLQASIKSLSNELKATRDKQRTEMDARHPPMSSQTSSKRSLY